MISAVFDNLQGGESTAQAIVRNFAARGIPRDEIGIRELQPFYRAMRITNAAAMSVKASLIEGEPEPRPVNDPIRAAIVETRLHPCLEFVVCQFARKLNIGIQIFHGPQNSAYCGGRSRRQTALRKHLRGKRQTFA